MYINWIRVSPDWFTKYIFYLCQEGSLPATGDACPGDCSLSLSQQYHWATLGAPRLAFHPRMWASLILSQGYWHWGLNKCPGHCMLHTALSQTLHSSFWLLGAELQDTEVLLACQKHHHHWRYQDWSSPLHKQCSFPSNAKAIPQARTLSLPQVLIKSLCCLSSASYAVPECRRGFGHRAISLAQVLGLDFL